MIDFNEQVAYMQEHYDPNAPSVYDFDVPLQKLVPLQTFEGLTEIRTNPKVFVEDFDNMGLSILKQDPDDGEWYFQINPAGLTYYSLDPDGRLVNPHYYGKEAFTLKTNGEKVLPKSVKTEEVWKKLDYSAQTERKKMVLDCKYKDNLLSVIDMKGHYFGEDSHKYILFNDELMPVKIFQFVGAVQAWYVNSYGNMCFITDNRVFEQARKGRNLVRVYSITDADMVDGV